MDLSRPSITVVTVSLNAAADLPLTIESVLGQTYPQIEYLVVDGLSHDATYDVLARYVGRIDRIVPYEDGGIYAAMNFAARAASGEYVLFLNAGDRFYGADEVESMVERLRGDPDIFFGDHVYVEGRVEQHMPAADFGWLRGRLLHGRIDRDWHLRFPCHQATFTRSALLRELGYDTRYAICADHEFLLRASDAGARMQYVDEIVAHYVAGGFSGAQGPLIHREWAHAYRKHSLRPAAVDNFFFQTAAASPFPDRTTYSGLLQGGAHAADIDPETGARWRWAGEVSLAAPSQVPAIGLEISGRGLDGAQLLGFACEGDLLGAAMVDGDLSIVRAGLVRPLMPGEVVTITPASMRPLSALDPRVAGWGFEEISFLPCVTWSAPVLDLGAASTAALGDVLIEGWSAPEPDRGLVWSEVEQATVAFALPPALSGAITRLALVCAPNPCVTGGQELSIVVNGQLAGAFLLDPAAGPTACEVDVTQLWRTGPNIVRLCVDRLAAVPGDPRQLGIALHRIAWC